MRGDDPAERDWRITDTDGFGGQTHRGRDRGDPVEAVEDGEQRQPEHLGLERLRQPEQREPAEAVVPEEELARIESIRQPAAGRGADEIEYAHHRQQAGGAHFGDAVVHAGRNEVRTDQAVGARAADEEAAGEEPEVGLARALPQYANGVGERILARLRLRRLPRKRSVGKHSQIGRTIAHEERHQRQQQDNDRGDQERDRAPALVLGDVGFEGKEEHLSGGGARGEHPHHGAAAGDEPAADHGGAEHHGGRPGAEAHQDSPGEDQLPARAHLRCEGDARADHC